MSGRNIPRFSKQQHTIHLSSRKLGRAVRVESFAELLYAYQYEFDTNVKQYESQPASFNIMVGDRERRYTPDFLVEMHDGTARYVEVHRLNSNDEDYEEKLAEFLKLAVASGWEFDRVEARKIELPEQIFLQNCARINSVRTLHLPESIETLPFPPEISYGDLISFLEKYSSSPVRDAMALLAKGVYQIPHQDLVTSVMLIRGDV
ncbi:hypothetical protein Q4520_18270 [Alteromonas sp. 1_MG-2023]|uniref:TnsA endonuclease N-terminal domain-containing protein n=1 Tax=Alteromonas sp. 1_MG-2023 TaxID=3062669 RepID=UPI0026E4036F|nr:TnsA endonuclease N-terminal domain-containing protein [Alteromonas sp. 1_MG-2023]MDO6477371.1 hypothetical protein [Alteromonas sp. 1_MG-2023]